MYVINLVIPMTLKHRRGVENRIMSEKNPSKAKRMRNLLKGRSLKKLAQTNCISLETLDYLVKKYFLKPTDTLLITRTTEEGKQCLSMKETVKDLRSKLNKTWL